METSYFVYSNQNDKIKIERFHNCTWEFENNSSLIEFGFEINKNSLQGIEQVELSLYVPWLTNQCVLKDLYSKLKNRDNSKFIFNDSVLNSPSIGEVGDEAGIIHEFGSHTLCLLPINCTKQNKIVTLKVNLKHYNAYTKDKNNVYIRFGIKPSIPFISTRKKGISKSSIIYDVRINEKRNIPTDLINEIYPQKLCEIKTSFNLCIVPNRYDIVFLEDNHLKSVRNLEYNSFNTYIGDWVQIEKDDMIVIFYKKGNKDGYTDSFSFFSIFSKEHIGYEQILLAIGLNILCGLLFFIGSYRSKPSDKTISFLEATCVLPWEIYMVLIVILIVFVSYFTREKLKSLFHFLKKVKK